jgi:hypothetical protein
MQLDCGKMKTETEGETMGGGVVVGFLWVGRQNQRPRGSAAAARNDRPWASTLRDDSLGGMIN